MRLPRAEDAVIEPAKVRGYLLSPEHPVGRTKARFFTALGFRRTEWPVLLWALRLHGRTGEATPAESPYAQRFVVRGILEGPAGRGQVTTVWIILAGEERPRLVTAYPREEP